MKIPDVVCNADEVISAAAVVVCGTGVLHAAVVDSNAVAAGVVPSKVVPDGVVCGDCVVVLLLVVASNADVVISAAALVVSCCNSQSGPDQPASQRHNPVTPSQRPCPLHAHGNLQVTLQFCPVWPPAQDSHLSPRNPSWQTQTPDTHVPLPAPPQSSDVAQNA